MELLYSFLGGLSAKVYDDLFYVFKCSLLHNEPVLMKLKYPLKNYYKSSTINVYNNDMDNTIYKKIDKYLYVMNINDDNVHKYFKFDVVIK